jgi:hypothetical protein
MSYLINCARARRAIDRRDDGLPPVDVVTLMCGRWYSFRQWRDSLLELLYPRDRLRLWLYTNSDNPAFVACAAAEALALMRAGFQVRFTADPTLKVSRNALRELQPGDGFPMDHGEVIAELYNRACAATTNDLFFLEDDMGVPPDALLRLQTACRARGAGYAVGVVKDRHGPDTFCWSLHKQDDGTRIAGPCLHDGGVHAIGLGGFACTYLSRWAFDALSPPKFKCYAPTAWKPGPIAGCDMVLCMELDRLEIIRVCDFDLKTRHYDSQGIGH